jgi:hypothetical protein
MLVRFARSIHDLDAATPLLTISQRLHSRAAMLARITGQRRKSRNVQSTHGSSRLCDTLDEPGELIRL